MAGAAARRSVDHSTGVDPAAGDHLGNRLAFETLISDTSAALFAAPPEKLEDVIEDALDRLRVYFQADRCALLTVSEDQEVVKIQLAAYSEGVPRVQPELNLATLFPWSRHKLLEERVPVRVCRISELPPAAESERKLWIEMPIRSALTLPIETGGRVTHLILLNTVAGERYWPDVYVDRLRMLGEMLVGALERHRMFAKLRDTEERLNLAADSAEAGLWALDCRTGVFWVTDRGRAIFGYSAGDVVTMERLRASVHPEDWKLISEIIEPPVEAGPFDVEYRVLLPNGDVRWVVSRGRSHFTPSGDADRLMGVTFDVTDRRRVQESLQKSEARLASAAELAGLGFYDIDYGGGSIFFDSRFREICGTPPDCEELGPVEYWLEHIHPDDRERVVDLRKQLHEGALNRLAAEYRYLHPVHGPIWLNHLAGVASRDDKGRPVHTYGVFQDITVRREAEEALQKSYAEIERLKDRLEAEGEYLKSEVRLVHAHCEMAGQSPRLRGVLRLIEQVAPTDSSVLIRGETGTGKELVAQAIHRLSSRQSHVMVKVNCAALPSGLVESELFGREKGAFTGALTRQVGRFEIADGSTIFLDEVGELSLDIQAKLLRVLEAGEFERLGSPRTIKVNVRLIAATNRDLVTAIREKKFREDLYYRLNVFPINVPPLRDRAEDIPLLVWAFLEEFCSRMGKKITRVPRKTMDDLQGYHWPGNVRELRNVIEHAAILTSGETLRIPQLESAESAPAVRQTLAAAEREHILRALERSRWRIKGPTGAATELGLNPATLYSRLKKLGIKLKGSGAESPE